MAPVAPFDEILLLRVSIKCSIKQVSLKEETWTNLLMKSWNLDRKEALDLRLFGLSGKSLPRSKTLTLSFTLDGVDEQQSTNHSHISIQVAVKGKSSRAYA